MPIQALLQLFSTRPRSFHEQVESAMPPYRELDTAGLVKQAIECEYFDLQGPDIPDVRLRDFPPATVLLYYLHHGDYAGAARFWPQALNALAPAERKLGLTGRPLLVDYDIHLTCIIKALAERVEWA